MKLTLIPCPADPFCISELSMLGGIGRISLLNLYCSVEGSYSELLLDDHGRLSEMKQSNFTIRVLRYNKKDGLFLPKKIFIKGKDIKLKLVINEWGIY